MGAWIEIDFARQIANLPVPHPSWVRGLKLKLNWTTSSIPHAAPFMGAWIEIWLNQREYFTCQPHPSWVRGLKCIMRHIHQHWKRAAPFMGAWIEIAHQGKNLTKLHAAPFMGAWIEIDNKFVLGTQLVPHPSWVRGLK